MRKYFLFPMVVLLISIALTVEGQQKTNYSIEIMGEHPSGTQGTVKSFSSTYWFGHTHFFEWFYDDDIFERGYHLQHTQIEMDSDGNVQQSLPYDLIQPIEYASNVHITSCGFNNELFAFYFLSQYSVNNIYFCNLSVGSDFRMGELQINESTSRQMAAAAANDTLYLFFVDDADGKVKFYQGLYVNPASPYDPPGIEWVSSSPMVLSNSLKPSGNVSACPFTDENNHDKIMVAFAGEVDRGNNEINLFTGVQDRFEIYKQLQTVSGHPATDVAVEQGSVEGGGENGYFFQLGYSMTSLGADIGPVRCEINMDNGTFCSWETTAITDGEEVSSMLTGFATYYNKEPFKREKFLYQMYTISYAPDVWALKWASDKLLYSSFTEQVPPISQAQKFYDLIVVAEGAPPYALNGNKLSDQNTNINYPSVFTFTKQNETALSTNTSYNQSVEMNMGFGPVTAGFKASFMEASGTSHTESLTIEEMIHPPLANNDSAGQMFYYYITPTVKREKWSLCDFNGHELSHPRNLFFFSFTAPQLKTMNYSLTSFADAPRAYDLESYNDRNVEGMNGMEEVLRNETDLAIAAGGGSGSLTLTFDDTKTDDYSESFSVSVGIDAEVDIFSASASAEIGFEYSRSRVTKCERSFYIGWDNPPPVVQSDTNNITGYTAISYIMKTTGSDAYYLLDGFKTYTPYFITYEVSNITRGSFGYEFIDENSQFNIKYNFSAYPNPCSDRINFDYTLSEKAWVVLTIYNSFGQEVDGGLSEIQEIGNHNNGLTMSDLPTGIYYYRLNIDGDLLKGKLIKK